MNKQVKATIKDDFNWFTENISFMSRKEQIAFLTSAAEFVYQSGYFEGLSEMAGMSSDRLEKSIQEILEKGNHV